MILWSSRELERAIADSTLDSWAKAKYVILPAVLATLVAGPVYWLRPVYSERSFGWNTLVGLAFNVASACLIYRGIKQCFMENENIDGRRFLERFALLTIPVMVRLIVLMMPLSFFIVAIGAAILRQSPLFHPYMLVLAFGPIWVFMQYTMLRNSFARLGTLIREQVPDGEA